MPVDAAFADMLMPPLLLPRFRHAALRRRAIAMLSPLLRLIAATARQRQQLRHDMNERHLAARRHACLRLRLSLITLRCVFRDATPRYFRRLFSSLPLMPMLIRAASSWPYFSASARY